LILLIGFLIVTFSLFLIINGDWKSFSNSGIIKWDYVTDNVGGFEILIVGIVFIFFSMTKLWESFR